MDTTGQRIKIARERLGLRQIDLADRIGVQSTTISRIESDKQKGFKLLRLIAEAVGVDVGWLMHGHVDLAPDWCRPRRLMDQGASVYTEKTLAQMLADLMSTITEQESELRRLRQEVSDTRGRLSRLEVGSGGGRSSNQRGAG